MVVIGITGEIGSGKDTFSGYFLEIGKSKKIKRMRFSDILKETLELWSLPITRHNLQYLAIIMEKEFGKGTLTKAVKEKIKAKDADVVLLEGVRWQTDADLIRDFNKNLIVYITADQKKRFERVKKRFQKDDENNLTFKRFQTEDKESTELQISKIGKRADVKIENNKGIKDFEKQIEDFYKKYII